MAIRDLLVGDTIAFTPAEEKIVRLLLAEYPTSGLGTAASLAKRAGVSDPTVVRLVAKLGFDGFPDFQARLLAEVEARLHSPLLMMGPKRAREAGDHAVVVYLASVGDAVDAAAGTTPLGTYDRAAALVMEAKGDVVLLGGRFSRHLAGMLAGYLVQLRGGVREIGALSAQGFDAVVDFGRHDVLVAFDYRRYQRDTVSFARQAAGRGARVLLFTDPWLSPAAEVADAVIVSPVDVASPFDTMVPALAQVEAFVAAILAAEGERVRDRIERLEAVRLANAVTVDDAPPPPPPPARRAPKPSAGTP